MNSQNTLKNESTMNHVFSRNHIPRLSNNGTIIMNNENNKLNYDTQWKELIERYKNGDLDQVSKIIIIVLGQNNNQTTSLTHVPIYIYLLKFVFKNLDIELNYIDFKLHSINIQNKINDLIKLKLVAQHEAKLNLTNRGLRNYHAIKQDLTMREFAITEDFKESFNNLTVDEFLALAYFSHQEEMNVESELCHRLITNRRKLAISMYSKECISTSKAASIAGEDLEKFYDRLCTSQK